LVICACWLGGVLHQVIGGADLAGIGRSDIHVQTAWMQYIAIGPRVCGRLERWWITGVW